jgi:flagellar biosynthetic protein FliR
MSGDTVLIDKGALELAGLVLGEALIGVAMGFAARVIFAAFSLLGEFISLQGGLGAARVLDPTSGASSVVLAAAFQSFSLLTFLAIDGHHALLLSAAESFQQLPLGGGGPSLGVLAAIGQTGSMVYALALRLALPVTVAMLVTNAALGLLGRAIPQLNLMTLQLPAHVAFLLLLVALGARGMLDLMAESLLPWLSGLAVTVGGRP